LEPSSSGSGTHKLPTCAVKCCAAETNEPAPSSGEGCNELKAVPPCLEATGPIKSKLLGARLCLFVFSTHESLYTSSSTQRAEFFLRNAVPLIIQVPINPCLSIRTDMPLALPCCSHTISRPYQSRLADDAVHSAKPAALSLSPTQFYFSERLTPEQLANAWSTSSKQGKRAIVEAEGSSLVTHEAKAASSMTKVFCSNKFCREPSWTSPISEDKIGFSTTTMIVLADARAPEQ
jgi:hypothetical protein